MPSNSHMLPPDYCPQCKRTIDAHASGNPNKEDAPKADDITICMYCAALCRYDEDMRLELLSEEKKQEIREESPGSWAQIQFSIRLIKEYGQSREAQ